MQFLKSLHLHLSHRRFTDLFRTDNEAFSVHLDSQKADLVVLNKGPKIVGVKIAPMAVEFHIGVELNPTIETDIHPRLIQTKNDIAIFRKQVASLR